MTITGDGTSLIITLAIDFAIQFLFYVPSAITQSEKAYGTTVVDGVIQDLAGAFTYFTCVLVGLLYRQDGLNITSLAARQIIAAVFVLVWCLRLGYTLFLRVLRSGEDKRFDKLKRNALLFLAPWFLQGVWVFLTALPVWIVLGNPGTGQAVLGVSDGVGIAVWVFGFIVEALADYQKNTFKNANPRDFVTTGLWRYSRYANYNGEITLWIGMFVLCAGGFAEPWQWVSIISPVFVTLLIVCVSGVKLLEVSSEEKYGTREDYRRYKKVTSKFFLWPPSRLTGEVVGVRDDE